MKNQLTYVKWRTNLIMAKIPSSPKAIDACLRIYFRKCMVKNSTLLLTGESEEHISPWLFRKFNSHRFTIKLHHS